MNRLNGVKYPRAYGTFPRLRSCLYFLIVQVEFSAYRTSSYVTERAQTLLKENGYFIAVVNEVSPRMDPFIKVSKGSEFEIFGVKKY